jgi:ubiquinone/menaquinone biosynthesis C-methylase UbiE
MKPMSQHFGEIHGVDVSDEMVALARRNLRDIPHAHPHATTGSDLAPFADDSFDFVYSYAVFQHIPSREVVLQYLNEARRVLKAGGILRCQLNGLDKTAKSYDTWSGVRISGEEIREFARENDMQLLALEGARTQYMWATMRKKGAGHSETENPPARIRRVTNAYNSEPVVPLRGRFASFTVWMENLPVACDLVTLDVRVGGQKCTPTYLGVPERDGLQQLNVLLGDVGRTGMLPLEILKDGRPLGKTVSLRVIPPGPFVPQVWAVSDGVNVMSEARIISGTVKVTIEETEHPDTFNADLAGVPVSDCDIFCVDPSLSRYEVNFDLPDGIPPGQHELRMRLGEKKLKSTVLELLNAGSN